MPTLDDPAPVRIPERLLLGGEWQLALDPDGRGLTEDWPGSGWPAQRAAPATVPALWDSVHPTYEGVGFYRREFARPPEWASKVLLLNFEGAAYRAEVWLNGRYVGSHEGAYTPFSFDITDLAEAVNVVTVRVAGLSRQGAVDGQRLEQAPAAKQAWHHVHGGLWGEVSVEAREWVRVQALRAAPDLLRERVHVEVVLMNRRAEWRPASVRLVILQPDGAVAAELADQVAVPPGTVRLDYGVPLPRPWPWHYDTPHRYRLEAEVHAEPGGTDRQVTVFGMRDFTVHLGQFYLNGAPVYVRGVLLQPHYPVGMIAPTDPELMRREITLMKAAGFNLIRIHLRPAPPGFLDLADELGMLIYAESSLAWIRDSPRMLDHCRREVQALIERDFNHPAVVIWGIFNENPPAAELLGEPLLRQARALDPTRVVIDNSGGALAIDQNFGWIDRAHAVASHDAARQKLLDIHLYLGHYLPGPLYEWLRTLGGGAPPQALAREDFGSAAVAAEFDREARADPGKLFVSELGSGGMMDLDAALAPYGERREGRDAHEFAAFRDSLHQGFYARGLDSVFADPGALAQAAQAQQAVGVASQLEAVRCNPRVSGYILTQLNDLAWEFHAGLLDVWRRPKPAYAAAERVNRPHLLALRAEAEAVAVGGTLTCRLTLVNHHPLPSGARVSASVRTPAGADIELWEAAAPAAAGIHPLAPLNVKAEAMGEYRFSARLEEGGRLLTEAAKTLLGLPPVAWDDLAGAVDWRGQPPAVAPQLADAATADRRASLLAAALPASLTEDDWDTLLDAVEAGQTAVIGALHARDVLALRRLGRRGLEVRLHFGIGSWMGCYHWQPRSPLFAGLPAGGLATPAYVDVLPWYVMSENGGIVLAGSLRNNQGNLDREAPAMLWHSDVEVVPVGAGRLVLCQYRLFDQAPDNPLASRMLANLLRLAIDR